MGISDYMYCVLEFSAIWRILLIARENSPYAPNGRKFHYTVQSGAEFGARRPMGPGLILKAVACDEPHSSVWESQ